MRRFLLTVSSLVLAFAASANSATAAKEDNSKCEAFCLGVAASCYIVVGPFGGKDKCEAMYEGCLDGCKAGSESS
ncbi:MAG: hypothetical protein JSU87_12705 [Gemmatimonadota bacterium]|nr:MAG: hypothetical protein JSU87_12705 [Gemmatimonadota bacterium]